MNILGLEGGKGMEFEMFGRVIISYTEFRFCTETKKWQILVLSFELNLV